jgi:uncharacterized phage-associated protein
MYLVYVTNGLHLALYNRPLIYEPVEAWKYGPTIRILNEEYKYHGMGPITDLILIEFKEKCCGATIRDKLSSIKVNSSDMRAQKLLREVFQQTKEVTGIQLSNWAGQKGGPWRETWDKLRAADVGAQINNDLMRHYFIGKIKPI